MNKIICFFLLFVYTNSYSQNYVSFVKDTTTFVILDYTQGFTYFTIIGDSLWNGNLYSKLFQHSEPPEELNNVDFSQINNEGLIREENKKVYYKSFAPWNPEDEILIYDFSLTVGDTFNLIDSEYLDNNSFVQLTLISIDSVGIENGEFRKRFNYTFENNYNSYDLCFIPAQGSNLNEIAIVEELGIPEMHSIYFPFASSCVAQGENFELNCLVVNGEQIYGQCDYLTSTKQVDLDKTHIYPNPTDGLLFIENNVEKKLTISLHDFYGRNIPLSSNGNELDLSFLPSGIYILELISQEQREVYKVLKK